MKRIFVMAILFIAGSAPSGLSAAQEPRIPACQAAIIAVDIIEDLRSGGHDPRQALALKGMLKQTVDDTDRTGLGYFLNHMRQEERKIYLVNPTAANRSRFLATINACEYWSPLYQS